MEPMAKPHVLALFEKKLEIPGDAENVANVASALEFMQLADCPSGGIYFSESATILPTAIPWRLRNSNRKKTGLLNYEGDSLGEDWEARKSIIVMWQISFEQPEQGKA